MAVPIGQAPGELAIVQAFVNTLDIEEQTEELASAAGLQRWLSAAGLPAGPVTRADLAAAIELREALRGVLRGHVRPASGHTAGPDAAGLAEAAARLDDIAARLPAGLAAQPDGQVRVTAPGTGASAALTRLLLIAAQAALTGTWDRLKVCSADDCQWAFYDRSPTRSGCWCSMQVCGSRAKARAYRSRAAATT